MITVFAEITAKSGSETLVYESLKAMLEPSRAEEGCVDYRIAQSTRNPATFSAFECFKSEDDFNYHINSDYYQNLLKTIGDHLAQEPKIEFTTEL